jgi:hypothetical protein
VEEEDETGYRYVTRIKFQALHPPDYSRPPVDFIPVSREMFHTTLHSTRKRLGDICEAQNRPESAQIPITFLGNRFLNFFVWLASHTTTIQYVGEICAEEKHT